MDYKPKNQIGVGWIDFQKQEREYIQKIIDTARVSYGPFTQKFEREFADIHGSKFAMFCNSGTSALQAGLHALKIKHKYEEGDIVLVPATTFVASVNVILQNNLKPVLIDVDPDYYEMDPDKIERFIDRYYKQEFEDCISPMIRAIMPVHIGGLPCDMDRIMRIAKKYELQVITDSCETMFATQNGKPLGQFGDVVCFSTYVAHVLSTGVGGFACTNDPELAVVIKSLFNHGRDSIYLSIDDDKGKHGKELFNIISKRFKFEHVGYSYRATEFEGALGLAQLHRWKSNILKRIRNAAQLTKGLLDLNEYLQLPTVREGSDHVFMFYPIVVKKGDRDDLVKYLEEHMIETRYLLPLINQPVYKKYLGKIVGQMKTEGFPVSENLVKNAFYIASHPGLTKNDLRYIVKVFHDYYAGNRNQL